MNKLKEFWLDSWFPVLSLTLAIGVLVLCSSALADPDCRPSLPAGEHYCATLEGTDCVKNPANDWKVVPWTKDQICKRLSRNPQWEHIMWYFQANYHCQGLGGARGRTSPSATTSVESLPLRRIFQLPSALKALAMQPIVVKPQQASKTNASLSWRHGVGKR